MTPVDGLLTDATLNIPAIMFPIPDSTDMINYVLDKIKANEIVMVEVISENGKVFKGSSTPETSQYKIILLSWNRLRVTFLELLLLFLRLGVFNRSRSGLGLSRHFVESGCDDQKRKSVVFNSRPTSH